MDRIPTNDVYFSTFASLRGLHPQISKNQNRVTFLFPISDKYNQIAQEFPCATVDLGAYIAELKKIKSMMYAIRNGEVRDID
ncbi:MAG: hypothetical protein ABSB79_06425 [Syntrophales bacterium]|jgi:hypothetical protein